MKNKLLFASSVVIATNCAMAQENNQLDESTYSETIVVTSSRVEMPLRQVATAMSIIDREDLDLKGYTSLAEVLRNEPSIGVSNSGGAGQQTALRIRGEEGYRTTLLIDGVDVADASATQRGPLFQNISSSYDIERIEVLRGAQGFMYGADAGGIVSITTQEGEAGLGGKLSLEGGSLGTQNIGGSFYAGSDSASLSLSLSSFEVDGINVQQADTLLADKDGSQNNTLHLKTNYAFSDNLEATLVYRQIDLDYDYDGCYDSGIQATVHNCTGENAQENIRLALDYSSGSFTHELSLATASIERDTFAGAVQSFATQSDSSQVEYLGSWTFEDTSLRQSRLVYGADFEEDDMGNNFGASGYRNQLGLFAEYQAEASENLFLTAGLRHDDNSDFGRHTSGRVSAAYLSEMDNGASLKYRATYGTGFRAPSLAEISYNSGPTQFGTLDGVVLTEEFSRGFDIGLDWVLANGTLVQVTYFDQKIEDEIFYEFDLATFNDGYRQGQGTSSSKGLELGIDLSLTETLSLNTNYTYNDTEDSAGDQRVRRPRDLASMGLAYRGMDSKLNLLASARYSANARDRFNSLEDYALVDLMANYLVNDELTIFARIENASDKDYVEVTGFNTAGRTAHLGARFNF